MIREFRFCTTNYTCAAAAAKGAALMLREQQIIDEVEIVLPASESARYRLHGQQLVNGTASCYVLRECGDCLDTAKRAKIHVSIKVDFFTPRRIVLEGVTLPTQSAGTGSGELSNSPAPKPLILEVVREVFAMRCIPNTLTVTVGKPEEGLEMAV